MKEDTHANISASLDSATNKVLTKQHSKNVYAPIIACRVTLSEASTMEVGAAHAHTKR